MIFRDSRTGNTAKFCISNRTPARVFEPHVEDVSDMAEQLKKSQQDFDSRMSNGGNSGQPKSHYVIHSEVITVGRDHLVMVSVERIQNDGFLVKLHDLKMITSDEFYLVRKSNGQLTRFNLSQSLQLMYQEDFRNLIFDLIFCQQTQGHELMLQNLSLASDKLQSLGKNPRLVT